MYLFWICSAGLFKFLTIECVVFATESKYILFSSLDRNDCQPDLNLSSLLLSLEVKLFFCVTNYVSSSIPILYTFGDQIELIVGNSAKVGMQTKS